MNANARERLPATAGCLALVAMLATTACHNSSSPLVTSQLENVTGTVQTSWGLPVSGARVYLIPSDQVVTTPITAADVLSGVADAYDEPLEDAIAGASAATFPQALTDASGGFTITLVDTSKKFFPYVDVTAASPADLYPGGNRCRVALGGLPLTSLAIEVTGHPSSSASYVGSTTCLICHPTFAGFETHAHRLGFRVPAVDGPLQSLAEKPGFDAGLTFFLPATVANFKTLGTSLWYHSFDGSRSFDKFEIALSDPGGAAIRVYLWRNTATSEYQITMQNLVTTSDPDRTFVVDLTYGGALFKQRYMLQVPGSQYAGRYAFLQYQHAGDDSYYDRSRKVWRDYHMDFFWDSGSLIFKSPDKTKNIESNCMACHVTGYRYFTDSMTTERMCDGVDDQAGVFDIDGDMTPDELNTGCEVCHGPGSEHVAVARPEFIVVPGDLSPGRENQICGRCHDRVAGNDDRRNDQPLNAAGEMAPPGTSRSEFLTDYTSRKGPKLSSFWVDELHSKSHHQQYPDFIKSKHYRNGRRLVACSNCHDLHGQGAYQGEMVDDPTDGSLCAQCHITDITAHLIAKTGSAKLGPMTMCTSCHYYKSAKTGAGRPGRLLGLPTGLPSDVNLTYWENDISSHLTVIPSRFNVGVAGVVPGNAMPVPYVNECAVCHDVSALERLPSYR